MKRILMLFGLLLIMMTALMAENQTISAYQNEVKLISGNPANMIMEMTLGHYDRNAVRINGDTWYEVSVKGAGMTLEAGYPQLPVLAGSVIIDGTTGVSLNTIASEYIDIPMQVAPSKGNLTREVDPASVPYTFADFYTGNTVYPETPAYLTEPFIIRDYRGVTVRFQPFVYDPANHSLRIYTKIRVAISQSGTDMTNALTTPKTSYSVMFEDIYRNMFLNFEDAKYPSLAEAGRILVIKHSMFDAAIQPYVDWKRQNGYQVDVVDVTVAGPTASQIMTYIQGQYNQNNGLMFVQIVGDAPQVPTLSSGGGGSDPSFALLAGGDSYPDIYVGRFSAQTVAELQTQVQKTIYYERDVLNGATWVQKGMVIASNEGGGSQGDNGESDQAHEELIRTDLLNYGYTSVDQMYQATGASAAQVTTNLNQGRGVITYTGHGSDTSWVTTGFNNTNVNALTNTNMLPFIASVACVNGNFVSQTCFAEAWLRAQSGGNPTGAVAFYGSTINQGWNPPMRAQDEIIDLLVGEQKRTIGGLFYNGSSKMIEVYGTSGVSEYKCWTIFGDASLMVRTKNPIAMNPTFTPVLFLGMNTFQVQAAPAARVTLSSAGVVYGTGIADATGNANITLANPPQQPMDLTLTVTAFNRETFIGTVQVLPSTGPYITLGDMTVTDGNNNTAEYGETVNLGIMLNNVGSDAALGVEVNVISSDQYLTINNGTETIGTIPANSQQSTITGFQLHFAANTPDQHAATFTVLVSLTDGTTYEYQRSILVNAPSFSWGGLQITEVTGNSNGRVDAGETITLTIPVTNSGHAGASNLETTLLINNVNYIVDPIVTNITELPVGGNASYIYQITFSSQIPVGSTAQITAMLYSGEYTAVNTYSLTIGLMMEDFESGTFTNYPWQFTGGNWVATTGSYNGSTAAKSATITHSQTTSMTVTMNIPVAGTLTFWKKVSSEQNYDFLKFYINGILKNSWSGTSDTWSQLTYAVSAGQNIFKWEYSKDNMVSSGSDCAWIDDIVFPTTGGTAGAPSFAIDTTSLSFGTVLVGETALLPVVITNNGTAGMIVSLTTTAPFFVPVPNHVVPAGESVTVNIGFAPTANGTANGTVTIISDDSVNAVTYLNMTGTGNAVDNDDNVNPVVTELLGNYPNPFNPTTTIAFNLKERGPVRIDVYNILGQRVTTLLNGELPSGSHRVVWNGQDSSSRGVASGVYFFKMQAGKYTSTKKMIMMK